MREAVPVGEEGPGEAAAAAAMAGAGEEERRQEVADGAESGPGVGATVAYWATGAVVAGRRVTVEG